MALFISLMSTTRRGSPVFFPTTCILAHQVLGVFWGTLYKTPSAISLSRSCLTCSDQCARMVAGLWIAFGSTPSLVIILKGGKPDIMGKGWWGQLLNAELA